MGSSLNFSIAQLINADGEDYMVRGLIEFQNTKDCTRWKEYKLENSQTREIRWLSIDENCHEYALYKQHPYSEQFQESRIYAKGYKLSDSGLARVVGCAGDVDVVKGDTVTFKEYEDKTEEHIIAWEKWDDGIEYSKGYYLDTFEFGKGKTPKQKPKELIRKQEEFMGKAITVLIYTVMVLFVLYDEDVFENVSFDFLYQNAIGQWVTQSWADFTSQHAIRDYLAKNRDFTYLTSMTADLDSQQKADVYRTDLPVAAATHQIIEAIKGKTEDVQENQMDGTVGLLTEHEYCLVYRNTQGQTLVQVSTRRYVYSSRHAPYHSSGSTFSYYRRYYYSRAFEVDRSKYQGAPNGYGNYRGGNVVPNPEDPYWNYSDSIRQESINSRTSSDQNGNFGK